MAMNADKLSFRNIQILILLVHQNFVQVFNYTIIEEQLKDNFVKLTRYEMLCHEFLIITSPSVAFSSSCEPHTHTHTHAHTHTQRENSQCTCLHSTFFSFLF